MGYITEFKLIVFNKKTQNVRYTIEKDLNLLKDVLKHIETAPWMASSVFKSDEGKHLPALLKKFEAVYNKYLKSVRNHEETATKENLLNYYVEYIMAAFDGTDTKWYEYEEDMRSFSTLYPDYTFELTGIGEEQEDIWRKFFKNGKMQGGQAEIVFPKIKATQWR